MTFQQVSTGPAAASRDRSPGSLARRCPALLIVLLSCAGLDPLGRDLAGPGEARAQAAERARPTVDPALFDPATVWSRVAVTRVGGGKDARPVVVLGRPVGAEGLLETSQPIRLDMIPRELVRQALLIAARDELGLSTRDEVIEPASAPAGQAEGAVHELGSLIRDNRSHEVVRRIDQKRIEVVSSHETPTAPGRKLDWIKLLAAAESLSRESFPGILKGMGLEGRPNAVKDAAELPPRVEERLEAVGFLEALLAVRDLHRAIRADGESPVRLGALVRGYALLGVLSEHEWHPAHRAYKARSLLYAQRLVAREPDHPRGYWHRAFALTLIGRHGDALDDLKTARGKAGAKGNPTPPDWVDVIEAAARFDSGRLARPQGKAARLATYLRMMALAYPRSTAAGVNAARAMVLQQPYCFRAHDLMSSYHGVSTLHVTTMIGPQALEHFLTSGLAESDGVPPDLKQQLQAQLGLVRAVEMFDRAGAPDHDPGEPSWGALAHLIRETRFVQVFRRIHFMKVMWSVPVDAYWNEVHLDVADHRYRPYLEFLALPARETAESFPKFAERLDLTDIETTESEMSRALWNLPSQRAKAAWTMARCHEDETAEMAASVADAGDADKAAMARDLLSVSPYHPFARATMVVRDWEHVKGQLAGWRKESGDWPAVLAALGQHYTGTREYDEAQRALARYIELSPDAWAYQQLAANFKAQGNVDRWQETLDEFLKDVEDLGLDHAQVRVQIANDFMGRKQWDKARPYAEAAAQTWAEWAMFCAARCAEGEKDWGRAETWYSRVAERYPSAWAVWYFFCKRTGQGNLDAARQAVEQYIAANSPNLDGEGRIYFGYFYWLDGQVGKAREIFARAYEKDTSIAAAIALAQIADDAKDAARRDELLKELVTRHREKAPRTLEICQIFLDSIFAPEGKGKPLDLAEIERILSSVPEEGRGNMEFTVGWFLRNHGYPEEARRLLERADRSDKTLNWFHLLATDALRRMGPK